MLDNELQPEYSEKLKKITSKIKNTSDIVKLKVLLGGLNALFNRYSFTHEYVDLYTVIKEAVDNGDIETVHLSAETIEDTLA